MMTPSHRLLCAVAVLVLSTSLYAQQPAHISLRVGDYNMQLPISGIQSQSLDNATLTTLYEDGSEIHISTVHRDEFEERTTIPAAEYLKDLFGDEQPSTSILQVLRDRKTRDMTEKLIENRGKLTLYIIKFPDKTVGYIADEYQPEYFVSVEVRNRPLQPILENLTGGKTEALSRPSLDLR